MPRKRSGYELVIEYFTSAEPAAAITALHTVQAIMRGRNVVAEKPRKAATPKVNRQRIPLDKAAPMSTENRT